MSAVIAIVGGTTAHTTPTCSELVKNRFSLVPSVEGGSTRPQVYAKTAVLEQ